MKRGRVTKDTSKLVNVWIPDDLVVGIDEAAAEEDLDRSKFIRRAVREKLDARQKKGAA